MRLRSRTPAQERLADRITSATQRQAAPSGAADAPSDRTPRVPSFRPATVTLAFGEKLQVVIKDLTNDGARIEYRQNRDIPDDLHISEPLSGLNTRAVVTWRRERNCGISFVSSDIPSQTRKAGPPFDDA